MGGCPLYRVFGPNFSQIFGANKGLISLPIKRLIKGLICLVVFGPITFPINLAVMRVQKRVIEGVIFRLIFRPIGEVIFGLIFLLIIKNDLLTSSQ